jgi:predicted 3-demethylubiquinone-9 3-methyltransferase (glyoxalase superfamily)
MRKPLAISFELDGQKFMALNGGPTFKFTEAISCCRAVRFAAGNR